jgi:hypothetical protein
MPVCLEVVPDSRESRSGGPRKFDRPAELLVIHMTPEQHYKPGGSTRRNSQTTSVLALMSPEVP